MQKVLKLFTARVGQESTAGPRTMVEMYPRKKMPA